MYLRPIAPLRTRANKALRGVQRIRLGAGEARTLSFTFSPQNDLTHYDGALDAYAVDPGEYEVQIGASSSDIRLSRRFIVEAR
jgi:beta-glucosidase